MRNGRYLAPWRRERVDLGGGGPGTGVRGGGDQGGGEVGPEGGESAEGRDDLAGVLAELRGKPAIYHCVSRIVNRDHVLGRVEKEKFVTLMRLYEEFCQVRVLNFCVMSNHFHLLVEVPAAPADGGASWSDEELLGHLSKLYSEREMGKLRWELGHYREQGNREAAEGFRAKYFARMWDLSSYMKGLKQCFTQWYNRKAERVGVLWEGRFKSVLVEDGHAARTVSAYIDLNPVRAGMVSDPKDYRWSGYGEAVSGPGAAREGLRLVMLEKWAGSVGGKGAAGEASSWRKVGRAYREVLSVDGEKREGDEERGRDAMRREDVERVLSAGGELSEGELLRCRVRYLVDGLVIGTEGYVNGVYALSRERFGRARRSGARRLRGVRTVLCTMRDLQREPLALQAPNPEWKGLPAKG